MARILSILAILTCSQILAGNEETDGQEDVSLSFRTPKEQRDIELSPILPGLKAGWQIEMLSFREKQGSERISDTRLEDVQVEFEVELSDWILANLEFTYELADAKNLIIEESYLRLGGNDEFPWFLEAGRMEMPFGEYNSYFSEEATVESIGAMLDEGLIFGYEKDGYEFLLATHEGGFKGSDFVAAAVFEANDGLAFGAYWSNDISESEELREFLIEALLEDEDGELNLSQVPAAGAFLSLQWNAYLLEFEYISALDSFNAGLLDDEALRPRAWNFELGVFLSNRWLVAGRYEASRELSDSPGKQYGLSTSCNIAEGLSATAGFLRGEFNGEEPERDLCTLELVYEF